MPIYNKAFTILRELYQRTPKFGKQYKYFLGGKMIENDLGVKRYVRYVDDLLILEEDKRRLVDYIKPVEDFLKNKLRLEIKKSKTILQPVRNGIDFLGYFVKPNYILVRRKVVKRLKNKLYKINKNVEEDKNLKKILAMINSYYGHFKHASSYNLRKDIYQNNLGVLKQNFLPKIKYFALNIK